MEQRKGWVGGGARVARFLAETLKSSSYSSTPTQEKGREGGENCRGGGHKNKMREYTRLQGNILEIRLNTIYIQGGRLNYVFAKGGERRSSIGVTRKSEHKSNTRARTVRHR